MSAAAQDRWRLTDPVVTDVHRVEHCAVDRISIRYDTLSVTRAKSLTQTREIPDCADRTVVAVWPTCGADRLTCMGLLPAEVGSIGGLEQWADQRDDVLLLVHARHTR